LLLGVYKTWWECDGAMVEINPLCIVEGADGKDALVAVDAKIALMTTPLPPQKYPGNARPREEAPLEIERANSISITSSSMEHRCLVNGAGLAMPRWTSSSISAAARLTFWTSAAAPARTSHRGVQNHPVRPACEGDSRQYFRRHHGLQRHPTGIVAAVRETGSSCRLLSVSKVTTSRPARNLANPASRSLPAIPWPTRRRKLLKPLEKLKP